MQQPFLLIALSLVFLAQLIVIYFRFKKRMSDQRMLTYLALLLIPGVIAVIALTE